MYLKKLYLIIISSVLILFLGVTIFQFIYWRMNTTELKAGYNEQIKALETELSDFGPMSTVWTVSSMTLPGHEVKAEDLEPMKILKKNVGENYITDNKKIIGKYYKISVIHGTPLTEDLFMEDKIEDTTRQYEVVTSFIPVGLQVGDYIDYRFTLPRGQDYIVMPHKRVEGISGKVITLYLTEEEIHTYESLLVDYFLFDGSHIHMTKYLEPGIQEPAKKYYPVSTLILEMLGNIDPNVTEEIKTSALYKDRVTLLKALQIDEKDLTKIVSGRAQVLGDLNSASSQFNDMEKTKKEQQKANSEVETPSDSTTNTVDTSGTVPQSGKVEHSSNSDSSKNTSDDEAKNSEKDLDSAGNASQGKDTSGVVQ